jgi:hypothetical protein
MGKLLSIKPPGELALAGLGLVLASVALTFAGYMVATDDHQPHVNGLEYLAIFAQPRGVNHAALNHAALRSASNAPPRGPAIDPAPTGSIEPRRALANEPPEIVTAESGRAWIKIDGTIRAVAPGDNVPGLGRIASIVERGGRWALLDESGAELVASAAMKGGADAPPFSRPMIFDQGPR